MGLNLNPCIDVHKKAWPEGEGMCWVHGRNHEFCQEIGEDGDCAIPDNLPSDLLKKELHPSNYSPAE